MKFTKYDVPIVVMASLLWLQRDALGQSLGDMAVALQHFDKIAKLAPRVGKVIAVAAAFFRRAGRILPEGFADLFLGCDGIHSLGLSLLWLIGPERAAGAMQRRFKFCRAHIGKGVRGSRCFHHSRMGFLQSCPEPVALGGQAHDCRRVAACLDIGACGGGCRADGFDVRVLFHSVDSLWTALIAAIKRARSKFGLSDLHTLATISTVFWRSFAFSIRPIASANSLKCLRVMVLRSKMARASSRIDRARPGRAGAPD